MAVNICKEVAGVGGPQDPMSASATVFPHAFGILGLSWLELTALALISSLLMLVLINILASFLRNQQLAAWSKFELFQIFGTATIVMLTVVAIVFGMCQFDMSILDNSATSHYLDHTDPAHPKGFNMYQIIDNYFRDIEKLGYLLFGYLVWVVKMINFLGSINWTSHPLGIGAADSPLSSLSQINSLFFYMVGGFITSFVLMQLQMRMLDYLSYACLYYLFPFGIFFRAFEPTRAFGGTLVGLSIALFLFYPIIMVFNDYLVTRTNLTGAVTAQLEGATADAENIAKDPSKMYNAQDATNNMAALAAPGVQDGLVSGISGTILFLFRPLMIYMFAAVVLPVINFIVLVEITRGITKLFGEEVDVSNLTRLI